MSALRIALAQINSTVGDFTGNTEKIINFTKKSRQMDADIVVFPELAITGYPPEDLVLRTEFINKNRQSLEKIAAESVDIAVVTGYIERREQIYNSAAFIYDGRIYGSYRKIFLPNYGVFDEKRYFSPGGVPSVYEFGNRVIGINICEDIWYPDGPASLQTVAGAGLILNLNASPYQFEKWKLRERMISTRAADNSAYIVFVNMVGGQDELIFEGGSMVFSPKGDMLARAQFFEEDLIFVDLDMDLPFRTRLHDLRMRDRAVIHMEDSSVSRHIIPYSKKQKKPVEIKTGFSRQPSREEEIYNGLILGVRDYVRKNNFQKAVIGISGGIDSALVATIAADALGPQNVSGIFMPSRYSSEISREDSYKLAENLGFELHEISIDNLFEEYLKTMKPFFRDLPEDITEQNIQARIRGNLLMAFSNKFNSLVLTTGNKSEMAVGYATLYGDMAGGLAVIKDILKTEVYRLSRYRNSISEAIPERIITREPSAELKEDQKDSDSLPPYEVLDPILKMLIEEDRNVRDIANEGFDMEIVQKVARMLQFSEYKRRQGPPGIKITTRAFGRDRRVPITNKFIESIY